MPVVAFLDIAVPDRILTVPILASFIVSVAHFVTLYRLRVRPRAGQMLGAVLAAMSVQWTVARAVGFGMVKDHLPFVRTSKGGMRAVDRFPCLLGSGAGGLADPRRRASWLSTNYKEMREINIFAVVLLMQSLPFVAAVGIAVIERTRLNDFAYWRSLEAQVAELLPITRRNGNRCRSNARHACAETWRAGPVRTDHAASAVSTSLTQYDVPNGIASSLKL